MRGWEMNLNIKSDMLEKTNRNDLLRLAQLITVDMKGDDNRFNYVSLLCNTMSEAAKTGPVKAEFEGMMFVVDKGATMAQTLQAWKEQAGKPFVEKFSPDILAKSQKFSADETDLGDTSRSYWQAAEAEVLLTKHPEYADKLSMLQILNAFNKSKRKNVDVIGKALIQSAKRFTEGEETFPITLENMVALNENKDQLIFALGVGVNSSKLEKRIHDSELKMLKNLQQEDLNVVSDFMISSGLKIAEKHNEG